MKRAWAQLRHHPTRFGALLLAIVISVGFVSTCLVFIETESGSIRDQLSAPARNADAVISRAPDLQQLVESTQVEEAVADVAGIDVFAPIVRASFSIEQSWVQAYVLPPEQLQWAELRDGDWPGSASELAIDEELAEARGLSVGDEVTISYFAGDDEATQDLRISGIVGNSSSILSGVSYGAFITDSLVAVGEQEPGPDQLHGAVEMWAITAQQGTATEELIERTEAALSPYAADLQVQTTRDYAESAAQSLTAGVDVFRSILLVFGAIALLVGMLIIANTFTILIAQRRRQLGLLRAVGASASQVQREMLAEAVLLGVIGSALGVAAGIGLGALAARITGSLASGLELPWTLALSFAAGVVITVLAAWLPSLRTAAILPLEALRIASATNAKRHPGVATTIVAALLLVGGAGLLVLTITVESNQLVLAVGSSALLALGVLLGAGWYVPGLIKLLGALPARLGPTPRLAVANAVRNPKRTTATCLALMLAVGLVVTLQVGSASVKASAENGIAQELPVDLALSSSRGALEVPEDLAARVGEVDGVGAAIPVRAASIEVGDSSWWVQGVGPEVDSIVPGMQIGPGEMVVNPDEAKSNGWQDGQQLTLDLAGVGEQTMTLKVHDLASSWNAPVVALDTLLDWDPEAKLTAVWASVETRDAAGARQVMEDVQALAPDLLMDGSIAMSTMLTQVLDVLLLIATGLLGAAVLIALIGVGNTLGLSVLERIRESGLLRALGLQRRQLWSMLAIEAVLLAVAGALVGVVAGMGFGYFGTWAIMAGMGQPAVFRVNGPLLAVDAVIAIVAGLVASVLPARRAAAVAPTEALAAE